MKNIIIALLAITFVTGCLNKKTINIDGHTYTLIRLSETNANGTTNVELWERKGVTNRYYTPSIDRKSMNSIMK